MYLNRVGIQNSDPKMTKDKKFDHDAIRTHNLWWVGNRKPTPYPLGHAANNVEYLFN